MKVLLTGSTGYIGRRLKEKLLEKDDINLRLYARSEKSFSQKTTNSAEIVVGDTFDKDKLRQALKDVDVAYYLVHSLSNKDYKNLDKISA